MKHIAALAAAAGPVTVNLLGYDFPILATAISVVSVAVASLIAPPPPRPLTWWQRTALTILLCILVITLVVSDPDRSLIVSTCWAIGIGYTGLPLIDELKRRISGRAPELMGDPAPDPKTDAPNA